uniref:Carboxypeptidase N subunit 2 n=1 Tax=Meleagris gallopavo TaxID=9103 RepID=A0A803YK99_MELGA
MLLPAVLGLGALLVWGLPSPCPPPCQCYGRASVFCSEERMREIPAGLPGNATQLIFVETELEPGAFRMLPGLAELELSGNPLPFVSPELLKGLPSLTVLSLSSNALRSLHPELFTAVGNLQDLRLQGNRIEALPHDIFHPLQHLQALDLSQNVLAELPKGLLAPLTALRVLKLSNNMLARLLPRAFVTLTQLAELLEGNRLAQLPAALLQGTPYLLLALEHNALSHLPAEAFHGLAELTALQLGRNNLSVLPSGLLDELPRLTSLGLEHNRLSHLPTGFFGANEELVRVGLESNPWVCDCRLAYLLSWLQVFAEPLIHLQASCTGPAALMGRPLLEVTLRPQMCSRHQGWDETPGEGTPGQCIYSDPEGTLHISCNATGCQQLSLRLPPPPPGETARLGPEYQGDWVLRSSCGTLRVSILVTVRDGEKDVSPGDPAAP